MLISEEHGGAGLGGFDALLVAEECGRVLAGVPLLGQLPATAILDAAGDDGARGGRRRRAAPRLRARTAAGELEPGWTVEPAVGFAAAPAPRGDGDGDEVTFDGQRRLGPRRAGRRLARGRRRDGEGEPVAVAVDAGATAWRSRRSIRYDATRSLGHVTLHRRARAAARRRRRASLPTPGISPTR